MSTKKDDIHDYIVVGGGSSGCTVAGRLAQDKTRSVLLLEAGGSNLSPFIQVPAGMIKASPKNYWHFDLEPDATRNGTVDTWAAGRVMGGGSSVNAMLWVRGNRADFDTWAKLGAQGWDYESLLPAMRSLETWEGGADGFRGGDGPQHVSRIRVRHPLVKRWLDGAEQTGSPILEDYNGESQFGAGWSQLSQKSGLRHATAQAFLARVRRQRNVDVESHALVDRVIVENGRAVSVEYIQNGVRKTARAAKEIILSAGSLCTPTILLRSGIGPRGDLADLGIDVVADVPGVGRNLQEHPAITMTFTVNERTLNQELRPWPVVKNAFDFVFRRRGLATAPLSHAMLFGPPMEPEGWPRYHILMAPLGTAEEKPHSTQDEAQQNRKDKQDVTMASDSVVSAFMSPVHPRGRGQIRLTSTHPAANPIIDHPMLADDRDVDDLMAAGRRVREIFCSPAMAPHVVKENAPTAGVETDEQWADFIRNHCFGGSHWVGTAQMGAETDETAVVDPTLKVRGVQGLRVVDASVMPTLTSGNTNAPCVLIGERAAQIIRSGH